MASRPNVRASSGMIGTIRWPNSLSLMSSLSNRTNAMVVRLLKELIKDKEFGHRIVPIIPDEARTFGLDAIFPTAKIFNTLGQHYLAVDRELMLSYKESETGQILHTGINEAGSVAAFQAVGTSYATHGEPMLPVYIFYSMFGFQQTGTPRCWPRPTPPSCTTTRRTPTRSATSSRTACSGCTARATHATPTSCTT